MKYTTKEDAENATNQNISIKSEQIRRRERVVDKESERENGQGIGNSPEIMKHSSIKMSDSSSALELSVSRGLKGAKVQRGKRRRKKGRRRKREGDFSLSPPADVAATRIPLISAADVDTTRQQLG